MQVRWIWQISGGNRATVSRCCSYFASLHERVLSFCWTNTKASKQWHLRKLQNTSPTWVPCGGGGGGSSKLPQQLLRRLLEVCCRCSLFNVEWNGAPYLRSDYTGGVIRLHRRCDDAMTFWGCRTHHGVTVAVSTLTGFFLAWAMVCFFLVLLHKHAAPAIIVCF